MKLACFTDLGRAMLAGAHAPGRVTHARQVKGEKPDEYSENQHGDGVSLKTLVVVQLKSTNTS